MKKKLPFKSFFARQKTDKRKINLHKPYRWIGLLMLVALAFNYAEAATPFSKATFHCISLYWSPSGGATSKKVTVLYKKSGDSEWLKGYEMSYLPIDSTTLDKATYRGSLVNLTPNTTYQIRLTLESSSEVADLTETTLDENFATTGSTTVLPSGTITTTYNITSGGSSSTGYKVYDGQNNTTINPSNSTSYKSGVVISASYVILRNVTIKNVRENGVKITNGANHIVIENCDISKWGELDNIPSNNTEWGKPSQAAIYSNDNTVGDIVIQRNRLHHPNYDTNTWLEVHRTSDKHPQGPQPLFFQDCEGGLIVRYNEIYSDETHYFNDGLGGSSNSSYKGFPGDDSDIYGNYISYCHDDGIESEGGNQNVRIWNNYLTNYYDAIANASTTVGPLYIFRNVVGKGMDPSVGTNTPGALYGVKMGSAGGSYNQKGNQYFFNNTFYQESGLTTGTFGTNGSNNRDIIRFISRNNILFNKQGDSTLKAISASSNNLNNNFDYDLIYGTFPATQTLNGVSSAQEVNGIKNREPIFLSSAGISGTPGGSGALTGIFRIKDESPGKDLAEIIHNFSDSYTGNGPDVGAHEGKADDMEFGIQANFVPPVVTKIYSGKLQAEDAYFKYAQIETTNSGSDGSYVNCLNASGSSIEWTINIADPTAANLIFRYANGSGSARVASISVNGGQTSNITFNTTTNWSTWVNSGNISKNLVAGINKIKITTTGQDAGNIDYMQYELLPSQALEAEDQTLVNAQIESSQSGFSGTGYVNSLNATGSYIEWTVNKANASDISLFFRYANGSGSARVASLSVNGGQTSNITFSDTGSWGTFVNSSSFTKSLVAGDNTIRITTTGQDAGNIDYLSFTSSPSPNPIASIKERNNLFVDLKEDNTNSPIKASFYPNPAQDQITIDLQNLKTGDVHVSLINMSGATIKKNLFNVSEEQAKFSVPVSDLPTGIYIIEISQNGNVIRQRIVKK